MLDIGITAARDSVTHAVHTFVGPTNPWIYDLVIAHESYEATVVCVVRERPVEYPFARVRLVQPRPRRRGSLPWMREHLTRRIGWPRTPVNSWKKSLREVAGAPSVFHAHFGPVGWRLVNAGLAPVVTSFYGYDAGADYVLGYWGLGYRELFANGAAFVAEGPAMRDRLIQLGAPPERTHVVPLVADTTMEWRAPVAEGDAEPRVLMAGRFVEKKGFVDGVAAFAQAQAAGMRARLVIMGAGPEEGAITHALRSTGLESSAELLGPRSREEFRKVMSSCHVFLQPSRTASDGDTEGGAPTTLLDAQALGLIVVGTDHADIPFVVDREASFLAPEGDVDALAASLRQAVQATSEWHARSTRGRRHVERQHGVANVVATLEGVYNDARAFARE